MPRSRTRASSSPAAYGTATSTSTQSDASSRRDAGPQRVDTVAGQGRHEDRSRDDGRRVLAVLGRAIDEIGLVEGDEARLVAGPELVEDRLDRRPVLVDVRIGRVDDLDEHVGAVDLLERGPERIDELVRAACG